MEVGVCFDVREFPSEIRWIFKFRASAFANSFNESNSLNPLH